MIRRSLRAAGLCLLLASCATVGPDYEVPPDSVFARAVHHPPALDGRGSAAVAPGQAAVEGRWWELYDDPRLTTLVEEALQANAELRIAAARLTQAQARYAEARAASAPAAGVDAVVERGRISAESLLLTEQLPVFNLAEGGISVSYQLDLFGKIRRLVETARDDAEAAQAAGDLARISIVAQVVGAYVEICHSNHELAVARHALQLQGQSRDIAERMRSAGRGTPVVVAHADSQQAALRATLPPLESRRQAAGYELAALLGRAPGELAAEVMQCREAPTLKQPIPLGDGAALLRRRPDVRRAERELAAATAEIGIATAMLYPDITLGASFGANGLLKDFGKPVTQQWAIGPLISWSIPDSGARARVALAQAGAEAALAGFDHVVLAALRETQTLLDRYADDLRLAAALREARDHAAAVAADTQRLYQGGRVPYLASLDAQRALTAAETSLADAEARISQDQIRLFLALGGGWRVDAAASEARP